MTAQAQLDMVVAELLATCQPSSFPAWPAQVSSSQLSVLWNLLPHYNSIWIEPSDSKTVYEYSRVYHLINDMIEGKNDPSGRGIDQHILYLIRSVSIFSREGVIRNYDLDIFLIRRLAGEAADVSRFDRREIVFHEQQLLAGGLATGSWSSNGSYVFEFKLQSLAPKGYELLSSVQMIQKPGQRAMIVQQFYGNVQMRDQYNISGQTGPVGPNARVDGSFQQVWSQYSGDFDLNALAVQLADLRAEMRKP